MNPESLLTLWTQLTGEKWRLVPYLVKEQAAEFTSAGFTEDELRLVVGYTKRMITRSEGGYNAQSILWRVMAADNWQKFQERLEMARESRRRRRGAPVEAPEEAPAYDPETIQRQLKESRAFRTRLLKGDAA